MGLNSKKINLLVMPTDICNMNCIYCFHSVHHKKTEKMSLETLKKLYDITFSEYSEVTIIWHGGEPLIMGLDFYKKAIEMQKDYDCKINNRMQSNLTLLTDEFSDFLCDNDIGIGTSFDGCKNDLLRGNSNKILEGRNKILKNNKQCGFIMVVSKKNIDNLIESYEYFKSINANFTMNMYVPTNESMDDILRLNPKETIERIRLELPEINFFKSSPKSFLNRNIDFNCLLILSNSLEIGNKYSCICLFYHKLNVK